MSYSKQDLWRRFQNYYNEYPEIGLALDVSRMNFPENYFHSIEPLMRKAFDAMLDLERGGIANPDEKRMVGHYWLRNPAMAPTREIRSAIESAIARIKQFAADVHREKVRGARGKFTHLLLIGIGGSALGPQFVAQALGNPTTDKMKVHFFDNTDPDGIDRVLSQINENLGQTLCVVVSKSGGTKETRNGMLEAENAYAGAGLHFPSHAVAVTSENSELYRLAKGKGWLDIFPMWDWVGGRTSELSAVGLLPAALQGLNVEAMLSGARACDEVTRRPNLKVNPAAQLSLMWHYVGNGKGDKNLIILPYKDRLELFSKYLQQLVMESLGKQLDCNGKVVNQGLSVFGNKGSTDQHAYVQQLRDGRNDFFVTFIEVLRDREGESMEVEPGATSGDYLNGFYQGTRAALYDKGRESITITVHDLSPFTVGVLIALFERVVGLYATLVNVNAYHQPGVEAGKKAAAAVLSLQTKVLKFLRERKTKATVENIAQAVGAPEDLETIFKICEHLAANPDRNIAKAPGGDPFHAQYGTA